VDKEDSCGSNKKWIYLAKKNSSKSKASHSKVLSCYLHPVDTGRIAMVGWKSVSNENTLALRHN